MPKLTNVPLPPEDEAAIRAALAEVDDPVLRAELERKFRARAQGKANRAAQQSIAFREALREARDNGYGDPEGFARARAANVMLEQESERRLAAIKGRVLASVRKTANRGARKLDQASKTARPHARRFPEWDRRYLEIVGVAEKEGRLGDTSLVVSKIKSSLGTYRLPHWEKTTTSLKAMAMSVVIAERGATTINLRLSRDMCRAALRSSRGPASFLQNRIRAALKREFLHELPEFWFVLERDSDHLFHAHGAIERTPGQEDRVDQALRSAGGTWDGSGAERFQQVGKPLVEAVWWAYYATKHLNVTGTSIDRKLFASSVEIRNAARGRWDGLRSSFPQVGARPGS